MTISVTQEDIDTAVPRHPCNCAISTAMRRATGRYWLVRPSHHDPMGYVIDRSVIARERYTLPAEANRFARAFDEGLPVEPMTFDFPALDELEAI